MIGVALLMPIDPRRTAGVRHDSSIVHLDLNRKVNDVRPVVNAFSGFGAGIRSQRSDCQRCADGENEEFLDSCGSFHKSSGLYGNENGPFVDGVNAPSALLSGSSVRRTYRKPCNGVAMP